MVEGNKRASVVPQVLLADAFGHLFWLFAPLTTACCLLQHRLDVDLFSPLPALTYAPHYVNFLHQHLPTQQHNIASYLWQGEQLWLIKAGARNGKWGYRLLGALAWGARLPVLRPVPNLGGSSAIATEARRLHDLAARGLRVPAVLAVLPGGLLISHLGEPGAPTPSLADEIESAVPRGSAPVLGTVDTRPASAGARTRQWHQFEPGFCPQFGARPRWRGRLYRL